ncbi:MAG: 1-acyl-sn-glycerol-3-phosphate acyltransferase [Anaplasmataceae bacterium]|nr:1-acyl-sn-glycerol-3-phosphate acyltransferase [Anaplasmataceae bacterium]
MLHYIRLLVFIILTTIAAIVFTTPLNILYYIFRISKQHKILIFFGRLTLKSILLIIKYIYNIDYKINGLEHLEELKNTPCIIAAKHQSFYETILLPMILLDYNIAGILKQELIHLPFYGYALGAFNNIFIDRKKPKKAMTKALLEIKRILDNNNPMSLYIFPEGTRTDIGDDTQYKKGILSLLYKKYNLPIIPMGLNSGLYFKYATSKPKKTGTIILEFCKPIPPGIKDDNLLLSTVKSAIENKTNELTQQL